MVFVLTIFFFNITGLLFSVGFQFPERQALPIEQDEYTIDPSAEKIRLLKKELELDKSLTDKEYNSIFE